MIVNYNKSKNLKLSKHIKPGGCALNITLIVVRNGIGGPCSIPDLGYVHQLKMIVQLILP